MRDSARNATSAPKDRGGGYDSWTEGQARAFQLLHVFLHELGHHHDLITTRRQLRGGRGEAYAERYARDHGRSDLGQVPERVRPLARRVGEVVHRAFQMVKPFGWCVLAVACVAAFAGASAPIPAAYEHDDPTCKGKVYEAG